MTPSSPIRIFFDASCLIAAAGSPTGGATLVLQECEQRTLSAYTSVEVLHETRRNIATKLNAHALAHLEDLLNISRCRIVNTRRLHLKTAWSRVVNHKDWHVVDSALHAKCHYLLTFDRNLVREVEESNINLVAWTPGTFIAAFIRGTQGFSH